MKNEIKYPLEPLIPEIKAQLKQGTKIRYTVRDTEYIGRIEVHPYGDLHFVNEHCYENDKIREIDEDMIYYNPFDSIMLFSSFEILDQLPYKD